MNNTRTSRPPLMNEYVNETLWYCAVRGNLEIDPQPPVLSLSNSLRNSWSSLKSNRSWKSWFMRTSWSQWTTQGPHSQPWWMSISMRHFITVQYASIRSNVVLCFMGFKNSLWFLRSHVEIGITSIRAWFTLLSPHVEYTLGIYLL